MRQLVIFQRIFLIPLALLGVIAGVLALLRYDWVQGGCALVAGLFLFGIAGVVARDLRKLSALAGTAEGQPSQSVSFLLAKTLMYASWVIALTFIALAIHHGMRWLPAVLIGIVGGWIPPALLLVLAALLSRLFRRSTP